MSQFSVYIVNVSKDGSLIEFDVVDNKDNYDGYFSLWRSTVRPTNR